MPTEETYKLILNGMPFGEFLVLYAWSLLGAGAFFLYSLYKSLKFDQRTPRKFSWRHFALGAIRVVLSVVFLAVSIIWWDNISIMIFAVEEPVPLNGWSAIMVGTLVDRVLEVFLGGSNDIRNSLRKVR